MVTLVLYCKTCRVKYYIYIQEYLLLFTDSRQGDHDKVLAESKEKKKW